jgi:hypothetical protein
LRALLHLYGDAVVGGDAVVPKDVGDPRRQVEEGAIGKDGAILQMEEGPGTTQMGREERVVEHIGHSRSPLD